MAKRSPAKKKRSPALSGRPAPAKKKRLVYAGAEREGGSFSARQGGMMDSLGGMMSEPMSRGMERPMMESMVRNGSTPKGSMPMTKPLLRGKRKTRKSKRKSYGR